MTEENQDVLYSQDEVKEMLDVSFLPKLQDFARRLKSERLPDQEIKFFQFQMQAQFDNLEDPLTWESLAPHEKVWMRLSAITQEDIDNAAKGAVSESSEINP